MKKRKFLKWILSSIILAFIINFTFPGLKTIVKAEESSSYKVEKMLKEIVSKYGEENIIFEDGIYLSIGETIDISKLNNYDGVSWKSENEDILKVDNNILTGFNEGTTFIVGNKESKYFIKEVFVSSQNSNVRALSSSISGLKSQYVVYIDPGHGGYDPGASGNGIIEKNIVLDLALRVKAKLEAKGIKVIMSRTSDVFVSLEDRSKGANYVNPDIFVSIHINSAGAVSASGIETFYKKDIDKPLANKLQNKLINYTGAVNRGVKWEDFHVVRETRMPASLVECGFLSNVNEANNMKNWSYQEKLVNSIVDGSVEYLVENISLGENGTLLGSRIYGEDRYETSYEIFQRGWSNADYAILAYGSSYPDALCATPLAVKYNAPIILVDNVSLSSQPNVINLLKSKGVKNVFIVGGSGIIPTGVENELRSMGISNKRLGGLDRYETSVAIAREVGVLNGEIAVVQGLDFADGLSMASIAAKRKMPILLTEKNNLPSVVSNFMKENSISKSFVVGGNGVVSDSIYNTLPNPERLGGPDRYETNTAVFNRFKNEINLSSIYIASGLDFPDALSVSALAGKNNNFVLLTNTYAAEPVVRDLIVNNRKSIGEIFVLGSDRLIANNVLYGLGIDFVR